MTTPSNLIEPLLGVCEVFTRRMEAEGPQRLTAAAKKKTRLVFPEPYLPRLPAEPLGVLVPMVELSARHGRVTPPPLRL